jgi:phage replication-related protein YjqB (UPF0714/DUF867 family)
LQKRRDAVAIFRIRFRNSHSPVAIIAPHGGAIEPGTSEIADGIAGKNHSFYAFEGIKSNGNCNLHVTSTRFDEPRCVTLTSVSANAIAIHGERSDEKIVFMGGLDRETINRLRASLEKRGFRIERHPSLQGQDPANICNRTIRGMGVQLELSKGLRRSFFSSLSKNGRQIKKDRFYEFVEAVRAAIS